MKTVLRTFAIITGLAAASLALCNPLKTVKIKQQSSVIPIKPAHRDIPRCIPMPGVLCP